MSIVACRFFGQGSTASIRRKCVGYAGLINNFSVINPNRLGYLKSQWCWLCSVGLSNCSDMLHEPHQTAFYGRDTREPCDVGAPDGTVHRP